MGSYLANKVLSLEEWTNKQAIIYEEWHHTGTSLIESGSLTGMSAQSVHRSQDVYKRPG